MSRAIDRQLIEAVMQRNLAGVTALLRRGANPNALGHKWLTRLLVTVCHKSARGDESAKSCFGMMARVGADFTLSLALGLGDFSFSNPAARMWYLEGMKFSLEFKVRARRIESARAFFAMAIEARVRAKQGRADGDGSAWWAVFCGLARSNQKAPLMELHQQLYQGASLFQALPIRWQNDTDSFACVFDDIEGVRAYQASVDLLMAIVKADAEAVKVSLNRGLININGRLSVHGLTFLLAAVCSTPNGGEVIDALLAHEGIDTHAALTSGPHRGATVLHLMLVYQKLELCLQFLENESSELEVNTAIVSTGETPLHMAASRATPLALVEALVARGADVNAQLKSSGETPLHVLLKSRGAQSPEEVVDAAMLLLTKGADVTVALKETGATALHLVMSALWASGQYQKKYVDEHNQGYMKVIAEMIACGVDVNAARTTDGITALHIAARLCLPALVETLIAAGANVHARDHRGRTPLYMALLDRESALETVERFVGAGASIDESYDPAQDMPPLAEVYDNLDMVRHLLTLGASPNVCCRRFGARPEDTSRVTLLGAASGLGGSLAGLMDVLLTADGLVIDARDSDGNTALMMAILKMYVAFSQRYRRRSMDGPLHQYVFKLLDAGADVNAANPETHETPLHRVLHASCHKDSQPVFVRLLAEGANVNARRMDTGETPLLVAVQGGCSKYEKYGFDSEVRALIAQGADVNVQLTATGETALHLAIKAGNNDLFEALLSSSSIDPFVEDNHGVTPVALAKGVGDPFHARLVEYAKAREDIPNHRVWITM